MKVITETKELTHNDLRLLSEKTGKSVKNLKRLKKTHSYLAYTSEVDSYDFFGKTTYTMPYPHKSPKAFFETIQEHQLSQML